MNVNYSKVIFAALSVVLITSVTTRATEMDNRIESSAKNSYVFQTYLKDDTIKTQSKDGIVTLTGTVLGETHKALAQETVASLPGVINVDNQLKLREKAPAENSDAWLLTQVKYSLLLNRHVSGIKTQVNVTNGVVTLKGVADSEAQKDLASEYAKDVKGVRDVNNEMTIAKNPNSSKQTVGEKIDDASITAQVKMAFLFHHSTNMFKIGVKTNNGIVSLNGKTSGGAEKALVTKLASNVDGVKKVVNNMTTD